jgi:hypothetical protein
MSPTTYAPQFETNYIPEPRSQMRLLGTPLLINYSCDYLGTLVHEFLHSFVNPWVDRHLKDLKSAGDALNAPVID